MKSQLFQSLAGVACAAVLFAVPASAKSVKVTLSKTDDEVMTVFVVNGNATTLIVATSPEAPNGAPLPRNQIANIIWEEPDDWKAAWRLWTRRDYLAAGKEFETLSKTYANLNQIEDSIACKAKYYQLDCLRRTGQYAKLMDVYDEIRLVKLSDRYAKQIQLFNYWGHVGKKLWEPLKLITDKFEIAASEIPSYTVPPTTLPLKNLEADLMVQLAYMRGIATEMLAREEYKKAVAALDPQVPETQQAVTRAWAEVRAPMNDYSRVFTLTYMSDRYLAKDSMERCMAILKDDPAIKTDFIIQKEAYALASFYKDLFGNGKVPAGCEDFLKEPVPPESLAEEEAKTAAEKEDK